MRHLLLHGGLLLDECIEERAAALLLNVEAQLELPEALLEDSLESVCKARVCVCVPFVRLFSSAHRSTGGEVVWYK